MLQRNMGDSSACFMQPFCYASGFSNEANKSNSNPIHALGQSVSFGRFMSESLAWEKWSSFSHNRYVEEAERFSKPGSVAQKKAFFEAHYKKLAAQKAAAALLEQESSASQTQQQHETVVDNTHNSQITSPKSKLLVNEQNVKVLHSVSDESDSNSNIDTSLPQSNKVEGAQLEKDHQTSVANSTFVELQNKLEDVDNDTHKELIEKQSSIKSTTPIISNRENISASMSIKPALNSGEKKGSTAKSLHMSLNFTLIREINRLTASVMRKFGSTRIGAGSSKVSKDSLTPPRTSTKASKNELQKHSSFTPLTENTRNKMKSSIISSPFSLRTEDRAASRKKKLEKTFDDSEAQKIQQHLKLKEKAEIKIRKLRHCLCFRPLPDFNKEREDSKRGTEKDPLTPHESPKQGNY